MSNLSKGEMVLGIIEVFDIAENAIRENNELKRQIQDGKRFAGMETGNQEPISQIDAIVFAAGRRKVYEDSICTWRNLSAAKDEETGEVNVAKFEKWCKDKAYSIPSYFSYDEFCAYFAEELRADYEKEKENAIAKLAVEDEGDE